MTLTVPPKNSIAVVRAPVRLDVVDGGAATDAAEREVVPLAVRHVVEAAELERTYLSEPLLSSGRCRRT